jgi:hypothetical protein
LRASRRRYRYYVSRPLITQDQRESSTALRIPAAEIEHRVTSRVRQWLLDPGGIYQSTRLPDPSAQRRRRASCRCSKPRPSNCWSIWQPLGR